MMKIFSNKPIEVSKDEIQDTFDKMNTIYKTNADIFYSFCKRIYFEEPFDQVFGYYISKTTKRFSPQLILITYKLTVTYLRDKDVKIVSSTEIIRDLNNLGTKEEKEACKIIKEILPLLNSYTIKYNKQKSKIRMFPSHFNSPNNRIWVKDTPDESVLTQRTYHRYIEDNTLNMEDDLQLDKFENNPTMYMMSGKKYKQLLHFIETYDKKKKNDFLFTSDNAILEKYRNRVLESHDLSNIDFDNKNISGLDISHNPEIHINFDKIRKDVSDCNFNGYDLSRVTFRNFNVQDTDFRNTSATIDLATCIISKEGKMNSGTLFDEDNTLLFLNEKLTKKQVEELKIKVYKKEK